jgi:hypothetical protein
MLTLRRLDSGGAGFMLLVTDTENSPLSDDSRLVVVSRASGSFVSTMQLPESGLTLHFTVPSEPREVAQSVATTTASAAR